MYKLYVCRYITSVYPLLRYSLCFFGLFSLHHWLTIPSTPETKKLLKKKQYIEDIYFFEVNAKYISSNELKISVISRVRSTSEIADIFNT